MTFFSKKEIVVFVLLFTFIPSISFASTLFENATNYISDGSVGNCCTNRSMLFLFTASSDHDVSSVVLKGYKAGTPTTFFLKIIGEIAGVPDSSTVICSTTFEPSLWTTSPAEQEISISGCSLTSGTVYGIWIQRDSGGADGTNYIHLGYDDSSSPASYDGSDTGGVTWQVTWGLTYGYYKIYGSDVDSSPTATSTPSTSLGTEEWLYISMVFLFFISLKGWGSFHIRT